MSLATNVTNLATRIATEVKSLRTLINGNAADLTALTTTSKTSLVSAINEVAASVGSAGASINDTGTSTTSVWSSSKTDSAITSAVAAVVDTAPTALNTLNELAAALGDDASFATNVTNLISARIATADAVALAGTQTITGEKTFSIAPVVPNNAFAIGKVSGLQTALDAKALASDVGDTTTNFVTTFEAGLI